MKSPCVKWVNLKKMTTQRRKDMIHCILLYCAVLHCKVQCYIFWLTKENAALTWREKVFFLTAWLPFIFGVRGKCDNTKSMKYLWEFDVPCIHDAVAIKKFKLQIHSTTCTIILSTRMLLRLTWQKVDQFCFWLYVSWKYI